ncbi:hypothetical protein RhiirC2_576606 [Rhizophagus irregularis]|uniref:Uncharacterized protein n=1 Tax=Rhizophagus irregularis TaxID=588596 RepID=A0A2N1N027_9GLOM|nr:hypothetical protein RhiirC2_576606 [Rhizophagus irregularis]
MANAKKKQKTIIKELQTNALTISSEEYIERSQGVRSIIARGPLINANSSTEASLVMFFRFVCCMVYISSFLICIAMPFPLIFDSIS